MSFTVIPMKRPILAALAALTLAAGLCVPLSALAQPVSQSVRLPNQEYTETRQDIAVKVLGGGGMSPSSAPGRRGGGTSTPRGPTCG